MRRSQAGYILVEILLAVIIISVALTAVAAMFVPATANYADAADHTVAVNLAQKQLELLKIQPPAFWAGALPRAVDWQDATETMPIQLNNVNYQVDTQVLATAMSNQLVEVQVTVSWTRGNTPHTMRVTAFYSNI